VLAPPIKFWNLSKAKPNLLKADCIAAVDLCTLGQILTHEVEMKRSEKPVIYISDEDEQVTRNQWLNSQVTFFLNTLERSKVEPREQRSAASSTVSIVDLITV
jgi:hypothetical protein